MVDLSFSMIYQYSIFKTQVKFQKDTQVSDSLKKTVWYRPLKKTTCHHLRKRPLERAKEVEKLFSWLEEVPPHMSEQKSGKAYKLFQFCTYIVGISLFLPLFYLLSAHLCISASLLSSQ